MIIAVNFDGTIAEHKYPEIGNIIPFAFETLKQLQNEGHLLILYTMRCGKELKEAIDFCKENGLEFWAVNENISQKDWTTSQKIYAHLYIEDSAAGMTLVHFKYKRPYVDWYKLGNWLRNNLGTLKEWKTNEI